MDGEEFEIAAVTHAGRRRPTNEDHVLIDTTSGLAVVADGMGDEYGGEIAAATACRAILEASRAIPAEAPAVRVALEAAAALVASRARGPYDRMGSTVAMVRILAKLAIAEIGHIGDVRVYVLRRKSSTSSAVPLAAPRYCPLVELASGAVMVCATRDHTSLCELVERGHLTRDESVHHPLRHRINRALGRDSAQPDVQLVPLVAGDKLIVCSDGLWSLVVDEVIANIVQESSSPYTAVHALLAAALEAGGDDNIGIAAVFWSGAAGRSKRATEPNEYPPDPGNQRAQSSTAAGPSHLLFWHRQHPPDLFCDPAVEAS